MEGNLVFLGSGSSKLFGLPTMTDLVRSFERELTETAKKRGSGIGDKLALYLDIKKKLRKVHGYVDMESIFSVVDTISKNISYSQLDFPSTYVLSKKGNITNRRIFTVREQGLALELLKMYKEHVRKECTLEHRYDEEINKIYKEFFDKIREESKEMRLFIFTTNYDRVIETYFEGKEINDLFKHNGELAYLDLYKLRDTNNIKLVKLHGSIDWCKLTNGRIVRSDCKRIKIGGTLVGGELMLYPIQQKDLYVYPWLNLFSQFKVTSV